MGYQLQSSFLKKDKGSRHYLADCKDFFLNLVTSSVTVYSLQWKRRSTPLEGTQGTGDRKVQASWIHARSVLRWPRLFHEETGVSSVLKTPEGALILARLWNDWSRGLRESSRGCWRIVMLVLSKTRREPAPARREGLLWAGVKAGQCAWGAASCFTPVKMRTKPMTPRPASPASAACNPAERRPGPFLQAFRDVLWGAGVRVKGQRTATPAVPSTPRAPGDVPEAKAENPKLQTECQPSPRASFLLSNPHRVLKTEQFLSTLVYPNSPGFQLSLFTSASCGRYEAELKSEIGKRVYGVLMSFFAFSNNFISILSSHSAKW